MNIDDITNCALAAITLLVFGGFGWLAYQEWKDSRKSNTIIQLWKNTQPRIQVSGKKYLEMLDNL